MVHDYENSVIVTAGLYVNDALRSARDRDFDLAHATRGDARVSEHD
jgi:hypothetical protein